MLEVISETVSTLQAETSLYPPFVQIWMKVMGFTFLAGIFFAFNKQGGRWFLAAVVLNIVGLVVGKLVFPDATRTAIGTIVHLLFWAPILWVVWRAAIRPTFSSAANSFYDRVYVTWFYWASLLMAISLVFDLRAAILFLLQAVR